MPVTHGVTGSSPVRTAEEDEQWFVLFFLSAGENRLDKSMEMGKDGHRLYWTTPILLCKCVVISYWSLAEENIIVFRKFPEVEYGVPHSAQGGVDAYACRVGDLLETEVFKESHP